MSWGEDVRARFPDWRTPDARWRWATVRETLRVGQRVSGEVIARAPFGVWLDIGVGFPALLLVPEMEGAQERRIQFEDYPALGATVPAWIKALGDHGEIGVTQRSSPDRNVTE